MEPNSQSLPFELLSLLHSFHAPLLPQPVPVHCSGSLRPTPLMNAGGARSSLPTSSLSTAHTPSTRVAPSSWPFCPIHPPPVEEVLATLLPHSVDDHPFRGLPCPPSTVLRLPLESEPESNAPAQDSGCSRLSRSFSISSTSFRAPPGVCSTDQLRHVRTPLANFERAYSVAEHPQPPSASTRRRQGSAFFLSSPQDALEVSPLARVIGGAYSHLSGLTVHGFFLRPHMELWRLTRCSLPSVLPPRVPTQLWNWTRIQSFRRGPSHSYPSLSAFHCDLALACPPLPSPSSLCCEDIVPPFSLT
ncbi:hypothetical protein CVT26_002433 [Gymnopilus dilepis]|uniref:Uncharacterized protein n=1 Tax=Gymnopilus dilepis TaxID=231916 RepID=A0A409YX04_9AGAR|nr:hypothetical protein CVT26_002433 [Gymnopilus dilepis]